MLAEEEYSSTASMTVTITYLMEIIVSQMNSPKYRFPVEGEYSPTILAEEEYSSTASTTATINNDITME